MACDSSRILVESRVFHRRQQNPWRAARNMLTLGNYLTPTLLGGKNSLWFTEQIYTQFITRFNWEQGAAFGFLLLVLSTVIVWLGLKLTGQRFGDVMRRS